MAALQASITFQSGIAEYCDRRFGRAERQSVRSISPETSQARLALV